MSSIPLASHIPPSAIVRSATCLNCWHEFSPDDIRFVSTHPEIDSDPQLPNFATGRRELKRFIPERFDPEGRAIDCKGAMCTQIACPRCKLTIPRMSLEISPIILSVLGAKSSGKSVFIASMVYSLRQRASALGIGFNDADLALNTSLIEDERKMFVASDAERYRSFGDVVQATQVEDHESWRRSTIDGIERRYLPPYTFRIAPTLNHPNSQKHKSMERLLCLYDNAGEHFDFRTSTENKFMTGHLARSSGIMFTYDPTQDRRFRKLLNDQRVVLVDGVRQDTFLSEAANRIRENSLTPLSARDRIPQSLVVVLTKFDMWRHALEGKIPSSLFERLTGTQYECIVNDDIKTLSDACRQLLVDQKCREIVDTAESISNDVTFIPVAAVGTDIKTNSDGKQEFKLSDSGPVWTEVPILRLLNKAHPNLFPAGKRRQAANS